MATRIAFDYKKVRLINTEDEFSQIADSLHRDCGDFNVLGFDCEWVGSRPVALLQLATARGNIYLIRLCQMQSIPKYLKDVLENKSILKVGVDILRNDARKLKSQNKILVNGLLDIRFLAQRCGGIKTKRDKNGLAFLAEKYLKMKLKKNGSIHSRWEKKELDEKLLKYAAEDAYASIEVFKVLVNLLKPKVLSIPMRPIRWDEFFDANWVGVQYNFNKGTTKTNQDLRALESIKVSVNKPIHNNGPQPKGKPAKRIGFNLAEVRLIVINSPAEYEKIADELKRDCEDFNVLGFDCEWGYEYETIKLLQLATVRGLVLLIRTCKMAESFPPHLRELLENKEIIKVGFHPWVDVNGLKCYGTSTKGSLDIRFLAEECNERPMGLAYLARLHLGIELDESSYIDHFAWEEDELPHSHKMYAARDAFVTIELFKLFANRLEPGILDIPKRPICCRDLLGNDFIDIKYTYEYEFDKPNRGHCIVESMRWLAKEDPSQFEELTLDATNQEIAELNRRIDDMNQRVISAHGHAIEKLKDSFRECTEDLKRNMTPLPTIVQTNNNLNHVTKQKTTNVDQQLADLRGQLNMYQLRANEQMRNMGRRIDVMNRHVEDMDRRRASYSTIRQLNYVNEDVADMSRRVNDVQRSMGSMKQCIIDMQQSIDDKVAKDIFNLYFLFAVAIAAVVVFHYFGYFRTVLSESSF